MRHYLLDTTPLTALLFGRRAAVERIQPWLDRDEVATCGLVYAEVIEYLRGQPNYPQRRANLRALLDTVYPYSLTDAILERYSLIRRQLRPPHGPGLIGDIDTLIAATALERGLIAVTCDSDYERVPGLEVIVIPRRDLGRAADRR